MLFKRTGRQKCVGRVKPESTGLRILTYENEGTCWILLSLTFYRKWNSILSLGWVGVEVYLYSGHSLNDLHMVGDEQKTVE